MGKPLIMITSITYAMKGKEILDNKGISCQLVRTPKSENKYGCGYSLLVPKDTDEAEKLLIEAGIKVVGRADRVV